MRQSLGFQNQSEEIGKNLEIAAKAQEDLQAQANKLRANASLEIEGSEQQAKVLAEADAKQKQADQALKKFQDDQQIALN